MFLKSGVWDCSSPPSLFVFGDKKSYVKPNLHVDQSLKIKDVAVGWWITSATKTIFPVATSQ